jgi:hypothetical protein
MIGAGLALIATGLIGGTYLNHAPTSVGIGAALAAALIGAALGAMVVPR